MGFSRKLQYFLVHSCNYSNKEAKALIASERILVNNCVVNENVPVQPEDEITLDGVILKAKKNFRYIRFHKPIGLQSTLHPDITDGLYELFKDELPLFIAGRLDKYSEGLMLLSDDGKWVNAITDPDNYKEKEYVVSTLYPIDEAFIHAMSSGIEIMGYQTRQTLCRKIDEHTFSIILTEGKNKQIRRMCKKLNNRALSIKRIRIGHVGLDNLMAGSYEYLLNFNLNV